MNKIGKYMFVYIYLTAENDNIEDLVSVYNVNMNTQKILSQKKKTHESTIMQSNLISMRFYSIST